MHASLILRVQTLIATRFLRMQEILLEVVEAVVAVEVVIEVAIEVTEAIMAAAVIMVVAVMEKLHGMFLSLLQVL